MAKKKILIIDNDPDYVDAVSEMLGATGYEVFSALDAEKGIARARDSQPDCILLDVMMAHASEGLDVAMTLNDDLATTAIPVLLVTGIKKPNYLTSSFRPGENIANVKGTLEKPVKPDDLLAKIRSTLKKKTV
jgi:CheY-like chemotaxis protein